MRSPAWSANPTNGSANFFDPANGCSSCSAPQTATRDASTTPIPSSPTRRDHRHLAFGFGTHFCLGALLARREATTAIAALADRLPHLRLPTGEPDWLDSLVLRGMLNLPASF